MAEVTKVDIANGQEITIKSLYNQITVQALFSFLNDKYSDFFTQQFKYSINAGGTFTSYEALTENNIRAINAKTEDDIVVTYRFVRTAEPVPGEDIVFRGAPSELIYPVYDNFYFKEFFDLNSVEVLNWSLNVLEKLYDRGELAEYLERNKGGNIFDDEDFISFWGSVCHTLSLFVNYGRKFQEVRATESLLKDFLNNIGVYFNTNNTIEELQYLYDNYIEEFKKRGTNQITKISQVSGVPNGELLRLVDYLANDEFIFCLTQQRNVGWNVGNSSPCYKGTEGIINCIKAYESGIDVTDLSLYPLENQSKISLESGKIKIEDIGGSNIKYGYLYNFPVTTNIANGDFRVPSDADWTVLTDYLGGEAVAGGKLKETGLEYWEEPNTGATNEVGFNARGGGIRFNGTFFTIGFTGYWWSATEISGTNASYLYMDNSGSTVFIGSLSKKSGFSLRTMRNAITGETHGDVITAAYTGNDGKKYDGVVIGTQVWITANLAETKYNDGTDIPEVTDNTAWTELTTGARCSYNNIESNAFETLGEGEFAGLSGEESSERIVISNELDYEVSFRITKNDNIENITFGIDSYDKNGNTVSMLSQKDSSVSNLFFENKKVGNIQGEEYWVRGVIFKTSEPDNIDDVCDCGFGNNLKFSASANYITPRIRVTGSASANEVLIRDVKIRPRALPFSQGSLGARNLIINWIANNSGIRNSIIDQIIKLYLVPYNSTYYGVYLTATIGEDNYLLLNSGGYLLLNNGGRIILNK